VVETAGGAELGDDAQPQVPRTSENDPAMLLGTWLRDGRIAAGFPTQEALADHLGFDRTVITKGETGDRPPTDAVLRKVCTACHLDHEKFSGLARLARAARGDSPVKAWFADYIDAEGKAHTIRIWQPIIFPGLFQTPEYAFEIFLTWRQARPAQDKRAPWR
jgi:transcriptional regulator with XRE-family HTH domain